MEMQRADPMQAEQELDVGSEEKGRIENDINTRMIPIIQREKLEREEEMRV